MNPLQKVMQMNLELRRENRQLKGINLLLFVLIFVTLMCYAKKGQTSEFSTVTLCDHSVPPTFLGTEQEQSMAAEKWRRKEMAKQEVCDAIPIAKVPYGLKYQTEEWVFEFTLFLKR